jgi:hypothetical protein
VRQVQHNKQSGVMCWGEACPSFTANMVAENGEAGFVLGESVTATVNQVGPAHPDLYTRIPRLIYPHTQTGRPAHPDSDTRTPRPVDPHTWTQAPTHPDSRTQISAYPDSDTRIPGPVDPHTRTRTPAHLHSDTCTPGPVDPHTRTHRPI